MNLSRREEMFWRRLAYYKKLASFKKDDRVEYASLPTPVIDPLKDRGTVVGIREDGQVVVRFDSGSLEQCLPWRLKILDECVGGND